MRPIRTLSVLLACLSLLCTAVLAGGSGAFRDIPYGADYAEAVDWCAAHKLMNGVGEGRFDPDGTLDRRTLATVLYRAAGEPAITTTPDCTDVRAGQWYSDGVAWAMEKGILEGYGGNLFGPEDPVTKVQLAVIFQRYDGEDPDWPGDPTKAAATRAEVAKALMVHLRDRLAEPVVPAVPEMPEVPGGTEGPAVPAEEETPDG